LSKTLQTTILFNLSHQQTDKLKQQAGENDECHISNRQTCDIINIYHYCTAVCEIWHFLDYLVAESPAICVK